MIKYIIFVSIFCSNYIFAQRIWHYETISQGLYQNILTICGDTVINGASWSRLEESVFSSEVPHDVLTEEIGFIKEENGIVEFISTVFNRQWKVYDYNLNVGDTALLAPGNIDLPEKFIVHEIDSIYINGTQRKVLRLNHEIYNISEVIVEGIGSVKNYLLFPGESDGSIDASSKLLCYMDDTDLTVWDSTIWSTCVLDSINVICSQLSSSKDLADDFEKYISFGPNPFFDFFEIESSIALANIEVYDLLGTLILNENNANNRWKFKFDMTDQPTGAYVVLIHGSQGQSYTKVIMKY